MEAENPQRHAIVAWRFEDILDLRPEWTPQQAEAWLKSNARHIQEHIIKAGWEAIEDLLRND